MFQKFTVKDIVFLAITAAVLLCVGMLTVPLVLSVSLFGIRSLVSALFYAIVGTVALMKVRKPGALTIAGTINGLVLLMMSPVMFFMQLFGSALSEAVALLVFRSYEKPAAAQLAATLYIPLTLPLSILFSLWLTDTTIQAYVGAPVPALLVTLGTIVLSILGGVIGRKLGSELHRAGKFV